MGPGAMPALAAVATPKAKAALSKIDRTIMRSFLSVGFRPYGG
jgi:hypothetical protein